MDMSYTLFPLRTHSHLSIPILGGVSTNAHEIILDSYTSWHARMHAEVTSSTVALHLDLACIISQQLLKDCLLLTSYFKAKSQDNVNALIRCPHQCHKQVLHHIFWLCRDTGQMYR